MSFFAHCKNLTPPTAVQNCVKSNFTHESETNLIISKSNLLEVYVIKVRKEEKKLKKKKKNKKKKKKEK